MNKRNIAFRMFLSFLLLCTIISSGCTGYSGEETFMLDAESYTSYEFEMFEGEQLDASISTGQGQLDVYLLDSENFYRYQNLGSFEYDQFYENILSANVKFIAPHDGFWYVVLLNEESYAVTVDVNYDVY